MKLYRIRFFIVLKKLNNKTYSINEQDDHHYVQKFFFQPRKELRKIGLEKKEKKMITLVVKSRRRRAVFQTTISKKSAKKKLRKVTSILLKMLVFSHIGVQIIISMQQTLNYTEHYAFFVFFFNFINRFYRRITWKLLTCLIIRRLRYRIQFVKIPEFIKFQPKMRRVKMKPPSKLPSCVSVKIFLLVICIYNSGVTTTE